MFFRRALVFAYLFCNFGNFFFAILFVLVPIVFVAFAARCRHHKRHAFKLSAKLANICNAIGKCRGARCEKLIRFATRPLRCVFGDRVYRAALRKWQKRAHPALLTDTRKTLPKLRAAQKYAVRIGGAHNHRIGLFDEIFAKITLRRAAGNIKSALQKANNICADKQKANNICADKQKIMIVCNDKQLQQALAAGAKRILLDNFSVNELRAAVKFAKGRAQLEASGGITYPKLQAIAATGINRISAGAITKNIRAADFSFIIE